MVTRWACPQETYAGRLVLISRGGCLFVQFLGDRHGWVETIYIKSFFCPKTLQSLGPMSLDGDIFGDLTSCEPTNWKRVRERERYCFGGQARESSWIELVIFNRSDLETFFF